MLYLLILENSTNFYWIPEPTQSFYLQEKKILVSSGLFSKVPVPSMTMHF